MSTVEISVTCDTKEARREYADHLLKVLPSSALSNAYRYGSNSCSAGLSGVKSYVVVGLAIYGSYVILGAESFRT